jgi:RND family efflux transporter MFP subunit
MTHLSSNWHFYKPILLFCLLAVYGCGSPEETAPPTDESSVRTTNVSVYALQPDSLVQYSLLPVSAVAWREVTLSFQEGGVIEEVLADLDDSVQAGQPLARLDDDLLEAAAIEAEAGLAFQRYNHERAAQLHADGSIPERELRAAAYELKRAEAQHKTVRKRLDNSLLRAPFSGSVAERLVERGQLVMPGTPAYRLVQIERMKAGVWVPENQVVDFSAGSGVEVFFDAFPRVPFAGTIGRIGPAAEPTRRVFPLEIHLDNADYRIRPGMIGRMRAVRRVHTDVLVVPREAIQEREQGPAIFVVEGDKVRLRTVSLGPSEADRLIVERGLSSGDRIVLKGGRDLIDSDQVRVTEVQSR